ncbi:MAG: M20/M25/M40 family metallo-hydrolase [Oscillospiraceae bacterium]|nr:M20/M25/M40 family metallo-hydrolase [Oscillospiraceae bacterium]
MNEKDARALERFRELLKIKTISGKEEYKGELESFLPKLRELYPDVFAAAEWERVGDYGILLRWRGRESGKKPVVLMAHQDVVDCREEKWSHPPFAAEIHEGAVWARGSVDTKCIIAALMETAEELILKGFIPQRDIYFAFGADEEIFGGTMPKIVSTLAKRGVQPLFVLDEGGALLTEMPMGIDKSFAMVAVAEKAYGSLRIVMGNKDGKTAPERISEAVNIIKKHPMKSQLAPAVREMLRRLAPYAKPVLRPVLKNISFFAAAVKKVMDGSADTRPMIQSNIVFDKVKALPDENRAEATFRLKLNPWDSFEDVQKHVAALLDADAEILVDIKSEGAPISSWDTNEFRYIEACVKKVFGAQTSPFVLDGGTDGRHFAPICDKIYRFGAFNMSTAMRGSVHHENERMPVSSFLEGIKFYREFIMGL